ncbi:MAG: hypothetical protein WCI11_20455 [Candidatus Methylumidiphilus sp.]
MNAKPVEHEKPRLAGGPCGVSGNQNENRRDHYIEPWELWKLAKDACYVELGLEIRDDVKNFDGGVNYVGATEDRKGHKPIRVFIHSDFPPNVHINDMKRANHWTWFPEGQEPLTPAEREQRWRAVEAQKAKRAREEIELHGMAAEIAQGLWLQSVKAHSEHPYLKKRCVSAYGIRYLMTCPRYLFKDGAFIVIGQHCDVLLVPMRDTTGALWNLQMIFSDPKQTDEQREKDEKFIKLFLPCAPVNGFFHRIGERTETVCIAEGYATGASIFEATGYRVFIALLAATFPMWRKRYGRLCPM